MLYYHSFSPQLPHAIIYATILSHSTTAQPQSLERNAQSYNNGVAIKNVQVQNTKTQSSVDNGPSTSQSNIIQYKYYL